MSIVQLIAATAMIAVALSIAMTAAWLIQQRTGNSGWVDVTWTFATGGVGVLAALIPLSGSLPARQILVAVLVTLWAMRLGWHIAVRSQGIGDDPRYRHMAEAWGSDAIRHPQCRVRRWALALVPPSELFFRMAGLVRLPADRD